MKKIDRGEAYRRKLVKEKWENFVEKYNGVVSLIVPKYNIQEYGGKRKPKWITAYARRKIEEKEAAWTSYGREELDSDTISTARRGTYVPKQ